MEGGNDDGTLSGSTERLMAAEWNPMTWRNARINGRPPSVKNHSATLVGSKLYVFGGYDGKENHSTIYVLDCSNYEWYQLKGLGGDIPAGRNGHSATYANGQLFIIGGWLGKGPLAAKDLHIFDIPLLRWIEPDTYGEGPGPCNMHSADYIQCNNEIIVFRGGDGSAYLNDLHALDLMTMKWREIAPDGRLPVPRANHASCVVDDNLYIFGGWDGQKRLNDLHVLNAKADPPVWSTPQNLENKPQARAGMTLTNVRGKIFLFGGSGPRSKCYGDLHVYDPAAVKWLETVTIENDEDAHHGGIVYNRDEQDSDSRPRPTRTTGIKLQKKKNNRKYRVGAYKEGNPNAEPERADITILRKGPSERSGHTATLVGRKLLIFGGCNGLLAEYYDDFHELDTDPTPQVTTTEVPSTALFQRSLYKFVNQKEFADITFIVEGRPVYAHKIVLCLMSERFRAMFRSGFREMQEREIVIPDVSYATFMLMMEYLYSGEPLEIPVSKAGVEKSINENLFATVKQEPVETEKEEGEENASDVSSVYEGEEPPKYVDSDMENEEDDDGDEDFDFMQTDYDVQQSMDETGMVNAQRGTQASDYSIRNLESLVLLLEAADKYMLGHLKQSCEVSLNEAINASNVNALLTVAEQTNATQLKQSCEHFLRNYRVKKPATT